MKIENCDCCHDQHYSVNLRPVLPQAKRTGIGKKLCPPCREFLETADDKEFVWCVKHLDDYEHDRPVPGGLPPYKPRKRSK